MKRHYFLFLIIGACFLLHAGCGDGKSQEPNSSNTTVLPKDIYVFIDKSQSVSFQDSVVAKKVTTAFVNIINKANAQNDKVSLFYLHGNTGAASAFHSMALPPFKYPPGANTLERSKYERSYNKAVIQQKKKIFEAFKQSIMVENNSPTKDATDIIGALEVVSKNTDTEHEKYLLILTDGIQTLNSLSVQPTDNASAQNAANVTLKKISKNYTIQEENLRGAKAEIVLPFDAMNTKHNKYLDVYWEQIFQAYQMTLSCN